MSYIIRILFLFVLMFGCVQAEQRVEVKVKGVSGELKDNVLLMLSIFQQQAEPALNEKRIKRLYDRSIDEIKEALKPFGYFNPKITHEINKQEIPWIISYQIELNNPIRVTELDIKILGDGTSDKTFEKLISSMPLKKGDVLDQRAYNEFKLKLQNTAASRGYLKAEFIQHKILVDLDSYQSKIVLHFDTDTRIKFGEVKITASQPSHHLIKKYIKFGKGDYYSVEALVDLQNTLNDTDYFTSVEVTPLMDEIRGSEVPVAINLVPRTKRRYSVGFGFGTDTGARARVGLDIPLVNDKGHRFDTSLLNSELKDSFNAHYRIPVLNPRTDELAYRVAYSDEDTTTATSDVLTLGVGLIHARGLWHETLSVVYQDERFEVSNDSGRSTLLMPSVSWTRVWAKERIYTRNGMSLVLDLKGASQILFSDVDFIQGKAYSKLIRSIGRKGRVLARGTLGAIWTNEFGDIPSSIRFFAGGDNSVRGYKYNSLGPKEGKDGNVIGGKGLIAASVEYEHNIFTDWDVAIFYDIGNAVEDFDAVNDFDEVLKKGAGVGVRWKSPIGPMRIDLAYALSEKDKPWQIHLNIGPDL